MENGEFTVFDKTNLSYETRLECALSGVYNIFL